LVPPENGRRIAARIPNARLEMIPRASHIFPTDQTEAAHRAMLEFLNAHANNRRQLQNGIIPASSQRIC
jgi:pimeloyl-ACP methyl ester carboxylesterase